MDVYSPYFLAFLILRPQPEGILPVFYPVLEFFLLLITLRLFQFHLLVWWSVHFSEIVCWSLSVLARYFSHSFMYIEVIKSVLQYFVAFFVHFFLFGFSGLSSVVWCLSLYEVMFYSVFHVMLLFCLPSFFRNLSLYLYYVSTFSLLCFWLFSPSFYSFHSWRYLFCLSDFRCSCGIISSPT